MALALGVRAQLPTAPAKTQIRDVLYRADGSPATGTLVISWPAFVTTDKKAVAAGTLTVSLGSDGAVALELAPNFGASPAGSHYTVVLRLDDGTSSTEYWTVTAASPTTIGAIRSTLLPSEMAMQVVSKNYLDSQVMGLANDSSVVHNTGNESIGGVKTFVNDLVVGSTVLDATRGVVAPTNSNFVWEGDSITSGYGLSAGQDWASRAMLGNWFIGRGTKTNLAVSGSKTQDVLNRYAAVHALSPAVTANAGYFFLLAGINDLAHTTDSGLVIYGRLQSLWSQAQADGYKVVAATVTGMQGLTADRELQRQALNLSIRTSSNWDYLLDLDAVLPDPSDTTFYQDGLHPTASGAVLLGRTAANLMPSSTVSSQNTAPAYDQSVQGWSNIGKWLSVGLTGSTDTLRVFPQSAGKGVQVVSTDVGNTNYRPLMMVGSSVQYSHDGGGGDVMALYPGGPGVGSTLSSATSNMGQYTPLTMNASEFRFGKGLDTLHFYPGTTGSGVNISSARADLSAYSPLAIMASNWSVDGSGNIATHGNLAVGTTVLGAHDYASFNAAVTGLGSAVGTVMVNGPITLPASYTVPANAALQMAGGGVFTLGSYNLTINGPFAGAPGVFLQNGSGRVYFGAGAVKEAIPDWWTTSSPNAYDQINSALTAAVGASGSTTSSIGVALMPGSTYISNPIQITAVANSGCTANAAPYSCCSGAGTGSCYAAAPNVPAYLEGNDAVIQSVLSPSGGARALLSLILAKGNAAQLPSNGSTLNGYVQSSNPYFKLRNLVLNAAGQLQNGLYILGSPGDVSNVTTVYAMSDGTYMDTAQGYGIYYSVFDRMKSLANGGNGFTCVGQGLSVLNSNNTWIHPQARNNVGAGFDLGYCQNEYINAEAEKNNGPAVRVRGSYTNTVFTNPWFESNGENLAQSGTSNGKLDLGVVAANEATSGASVVGTNGLVIVGGRTGYNLPWTTWIASKAYGRIQYVIPPANSACGATDELCFQAWKASTAYSTGDVVLPKNNFVGNGRWYQATAGCTSGTSEPVWPVAEAATVTDSGGCAWTAHQIAYGVYTAGTSGSSQPTWTYTVGGTISDNSVTWQVKVNNGLATNAGNNLWVNAGGMAGAPAIGPGGDATMTQYNLMGAGSGDLLTNGGSTPQSTFLTPGTAASTYVPQTRTVNGYALTANITIPFTVPNALMWPGFQQYVLTQAVGGLATPNTIGPGAYTASGTPSAIAGTSTTSAMVRYASATTGNAVAGP